VNAFATVTRDGTARSNHAGAAGLATSLLPRDGAEKPELARKCWHNEPRRVAITFADRPGLVLALRRKCATLPSLNIAE
jgi:hypothetical protein